MALNRNAQTNATHPWAQTHSGRPFPLIDPTPADVHWPDVVWALAHSFRYAGNAGPYSVAQHSILVADDLPPELRAYGALHDAQEFAMGDMTKPTQLALAALGMDMAPFRLLKARIDRAIFGAAGLEWPMPLEIAKVVKMSDVRVTLAEKRDLLAATPGKTDAEWLFDTTAPQPTARKVKPWSIEHTIIEFNHELRRMGVTI